MTARSADVTFGIITPTFHRERLLRRFLKRVVRQSYPHWRLVVVHDGPGQATAALVDQFKIKAPRIECIQTIERANDFGVTPRRTGLADLVSTPPDYCVLWDDDNYFNVGALQAIATALVKADRPDMLLVSMEYRARLLPPPGISIPDLQPGQIDTACLVMRPHLALAGYEEILRRDHPSLYTQDFMLFDHLRRTGARIESAREACIGVHDGLRWKPYLRHLLGLKPLDLGKRISGRRSDEASR